MVACSVVVWHTRLADHVRLYFLTEREDRGQYSLQWRSESPARGFDHLVGGDRSSSKPFSCRPQYRFPRFACQRHDDCSTTAGCLRRQRKDSMGQGDVDVVTKSTTPDVYHVSSHVIGTLHLRFPLQSNCSLNLAQVVTRSCHRQTLQRRARLLQLQTGRISFEWNGTIFSLQWARRHHSDKDGTHDGEYSRSASTYSTIHFSPSLYLPDYCLFSFPHTEQLSKYSTESSSRPCQAGECELVCL